MRFFLLVLHLIVTLILIGVVLLQKGEDVSSGAGSNAMGMFSARGSKNFLSRITAILATFFFVNCLILAVLVRKEAHLVAPKKNNPAVPISPDPVPESAPESVAADKKEEKIPPLPKADVSPAAAPVSKVTVPAAPLKPNAGKTLIPSKKLKP